MTQTTDHRAKALLNDLYAKRNNAYKRAMSAEHDVLLAVKFGDTLSKTCWASDTGQRVWECVCSQCREIRKTARDTGELPWYCTPETD
jgi:hypothetical protein